MCLMADTSGQSPARGTLVCFRCGACCSDFQPALSVAEARRISDALGLGWVKFLDHYTDSRWVGDTFLLRQRHGSCVFLERHEGSALSTCLIEPFKPSACRDWMPGWEKTECRKGLARYWELTADCSGKLQGPEEKIRQFQSFLEQL
ncbi:MAG: YkgJ family cysteine cluster protein [Chloroflexota bacterium]